jgi:hypothetical protein
VSVWGFLSVLLLLWRVLNLPLLIATAAAAAAAAATPRRICWRRHKRPSFQALSCRCRLFHELFCINLPPKMMPVTTPTMTPAAKITPIFHSLMGVASLQNGTVKVALLLPLLSKLMSLMRSV